mmetsp:Transcript_64652/g.202473  ORF Transcript_64652/g.202473 Transcript_64652/m.202473 type:complete len:228 (+) Transcript_64652:952-1635(+)
MLDPPAEQHLLVVCQLQLLLQVPQALLCLAELRLLDPGRVGGADRGPQLLDVLRRKGFREGGGCRLPAMFCLDGRKVLRSSLRLLHRHAGRAGALQCHAQPSDLPGQRQPRFRGHGLPQLRLRSFAAHQHSQLRIPGSDERLLDAGLAGALELGPDFVNVLLLAREPQGLRGDLSTLLLLKLLQQGGSLLDGTLLDALRLCLLDALPQGYLGAPHHGVLQLTMCIRT